MSNSEDKYEDDIGLVGDAREQCSTGRSKGTPGTRPNKKYKESLKYRRPMLLGTANKDGRPKQRVPYKSHWRLRKDARRKNKEDFENGKTTPSTDMMKKFGIKVGRPKFQEYEGRGTIEVEWEQKNGHAYHPKRR